jgi:hypothetical protein
MNIPASRLERMRRSEQLYCQVQDIPASAQSRAVALCRFGACSVCGSSTDGAHSSARGPLFCERCCPACHPVEAVAP